MASIRLQKIRKVRQNGNYYIVLHVGNDGSQEMWFSGTAHIRQIIKGKFEPRILKEMLADIISQDPELETTDLIKPSVYSETEFQKVIL